MCGLFAVAGGVVYGEQGGRGADDPPTPAEPAAPGVCEAAAAADPDTGAGPLQHGPAPRHAQGSRLHGCWHPGSGRA